MQSKLLASEGNCLSGIAYIRIRSRNEIFPFLSPLHCTITIFFLCSWLGFLELSRIGVYRSIVVFLAFTRFVS